MSRLHATTVRYERQRLPAHSEIGNTKSAGCGRQRRPQTGASTWNPVMMSLASCWYLGSSGRGDWIVIETAKVLSLLGMTATTAVAPRGDPPFGRGMV